MGFFWFINVYQWFISPFLVAYIILTLLFFKNIPIVLPNKKIISKYLVVTPLQEILPATQQVLGRRSASCSGNKSWLGGGSTSISGGEGPRAGRGGGTGDIPPKHWGILKDHSMG